MAANDLDEEFDYEADLEDLPDHPPTAQVIGDPSVIVNDLHVTYHVVGSRTRVSAPANDNLLKKILRKGRSLTGGHTEVKAIRGVSFTAHHGESIGLIGTNGSGKSTLLKAIAGLLAPSQGEIYVSGIPSLLGVSAVLMKELTGERNVMIGGLALGLSRKEVDERFDEIVDFSGLGDAVYLPMKTYSAGMGARLRFAISTAATPDVLMIDEALATGDAGFRERSRQRIDEIRGEAGTVFVVAHSTASIRAMCTRVIWLDQGQIVMDGDPETVTNEYRKHVKELTARREEIRAARRASSA
jgi:teichoic acid transport system ATP-binding protein